MNGFKGIEPGPLAGIIAQTERAPQLTTARVANRMARGLVPHQTAIAKALTLSMTTPPGILKILEQAGEIAGMGIKTQMAEALVAQLEPVTAYAAALAKAQVDQFNPAAAIVASIRGLRLPDMDQSASIGGLKALKLGLDTNIGSLGTAGIRAALDTVALASAVAIRPMRPTPRTRVVSTRQTTRGWDEVDEFLARYHPALVDKRRAMWDVDRPDGISGAANAAAELMRILVDHLAPCPLVWMFMRSKGLNTKHRPDQRPERRHHYSVIASAYGLELDTMLRLTGGGQLSKRLENIKHDGWRREPAEVRATLMVLVGTVEEFLAYLAASIRV